MVDEMIRGVFMPHPTIEHVSLSVTERRESLDYKCSVFPYD